MHVLFGFAKVQEVRHQLVVVKIWVQFHSNEYGFFMDKVTLGRFFFECLRFSCQSSIHQCTSLPLPLMYAQSAASLSQT
jgi:hypothetical protein